MANIESRHWWFVARRRILEDLIAMRIVPRANARILEAGCGTGGNLDLLGGFGQVIAFEYEEYARDIARTRTNVDVQSGHLPDGLDCIDGSFDLIALFDVLEHIQQDCASLSALGELLAPGGKLFLTVPALQFLWSEHDVLHHHRRRYSKRHLRSVIEGAGLKVDFISYFNFFLLPAAIIERLGSRLVGGKPTLEQVPSPAINGFLNRIFAFERYLLRSVSLPVGLSLCAICSHGQK